MEIVINLWDDYDPYVIFNYTYNGIEISDKISLVLVNSTLPSGGSFYRFICPVSGENAMKLYLYDGHFQHRKSITKGRYKIQTMNRTRKNSIPVIAGIQHKRQEKIVAQRDKKYFMPYYAGSYTKKYIQMLYALGRL